MYPPLGLCKRCAEIRIELIPTVGDKLTFAAYENLNSRNHFDNEAKDHCAAITPLRT